LQPQNIKHFPITAWNVGIDAIIGPTKSLGECFPVVLGRMKLVDAKPTVNNHLAIRRWDANVYCKFLSVSVLPFRACSQNAPEASLE
jgi:hypothetical protein